LYVHHLLQLRAGCVVCFHEVPPSKEMLPKFILFLYLLPGQSGNPDRCKLGHHSTIRVPNQTIN
jgi:hypothetical protein